MNNLPTTKQNSNLALKRAKNLLSITDKILNRNSALAKEVFDHNIYVGLGHSGSVNSVAITPDGKYIVSGSDDETIKLWDIKSGEEIAQFISFEDGEWISSTKNGYYNCSENAYKYFNFQNNKEVITDRNHPIYKQRKKKNLLEDILS